MGNLAFSWVQIIAHNKARLSLIWSVVSLVVMLGLVYVDYSVIRHEVGLLGLGLVLMAVVVGYFLESPKIAFVQFLMSVYAVFMVMGLVGWFGLSLTLDTVLGLMVLMTLVSSNLIHILSTLSREMARGLFQYDAIPEAIKLNHSPILLSNLTTAMGFAALAFAEPMYFNMAWLVILGALISYFMTLTWLPFILLNWLLEFRVGNYSDRHGLKFLTTFLEKNALLRNFTILTAGALFFALIYLNQSKFESLNEMLLLITLFMVMFWLAWADFKLALINLGSNVLALLISISIFSFIMPESEWSWILWMLPLGIIVDDGIHFFTRYARAKQGFFNTNASAITYAMASVGRAVWITSWVLLVGLFVLLFSEAEVVVHAAGMILIAVIVTTFIVLLFLPALLVSKQH